MMIRKPVRLRKGDIVAIVSPSFSLPSVLPDLARKGMQNLEQYLGLETVVMSNTFSGIDYAYRKPEVRAGDLNEAFSDSSLRGIISTIGGYESARILKHLDGEIIESNPKIFTGFSNTTTITSYLTRHYIASIYDGSVMAGFAQTENFPEEFAVYSETILFKDST